MGKKGRGRGHSSSSRGRVGSPGIGRVKKNSANNAKTPAILTGIDDNNLHPLYVPRSPVRTRATTMNTGKPPQRQPGIGEPSSSKAGIPDIEISNVYDSLSDMSDEEDGSGGEGGGDRPVDNTAKEDGVITREKRMPPIHIPNTKRETVDKMLLEAKCAFILRVQEESVTVFSFAREMYGKILAALKAANISYYTHDPPDTVPVKIVLSGYAPRSIPELMDDLERQKN